MKVCLLCSVAILEMFVFGRTEGMCVEGGGEDEEEGVESL